MSVAGYVTELMKACPFIGVTTEDVRTDMLEDAPPCYAIVRIAEEPVAKRYLNGDSVRRYTFRLEANKTAATEAQRAANQEAYEQVSGWLEQLSRKRQLPSMDYGQQATGIAPVKDAELIEKGATVDHAVYGMTFALTYYQKARKN